MTRLRAATTGHSGLKSFSPAGQALINQIQKHTWVFFFLYCKPLAILPKAIRLHVGVINWFVNVRN